MTIEIDEIFIEINEYMSVKYGEKWVEAIGFDKYFEVRDKYENLNEKDRLKLLDSV